jgi:uncharacterized circularly permuted ATP-grasp superfamily protein/uncharacterized alpha-E superfamily protein
MPEFDTPKREHDRGTAAMPDLARLLADYHVPAGHFDELLEAPGTPRRHWAAFFAGAGDTGPDALTRAHHRITRQLHENGVTYNVHATGGAPRDWALDVLPHIVPAREWEPLTSGLRQRARLLNAIAADVYGEQQLLTGGAIPAAVVFGHDRFLRSCHGIRPPGGTFLHVVAFDLTRGPDGQWRVMVTRAQAPSGAGYALENRLTVSRIFPDAFRDQHVRLLAPFFRTLQETMVEGSPRESGTPHIVLLTPGPYNETYFEHAYLSRYLGFTLAEGADLTVRDDRVWLKTVTGLQPVNGILRRLDDDFSDPLELRSDSTLGVPGLVQAWRAGNVLVANAFGTGVLESSALNPYLPAVCQRLLGEDLAVPSPMSWWCGDRVTLAAALEHLPAMTIKSAFGGYDATTIAATDLDAAARAAWVERICEWPRNYVLEAYVPLSHAPVWQDARLQSRALMMRVFLVADGTGDYSVLPGALSRIAGSEGQLVSGQRGGGSKDTWVLSDAPVERFSLLPGRLRAEDIVRSERLVSSRAGEHLFWMGRYAERSENGARLLRAVLTRLHQGQPLVSSGSRPIIATCRRHGLLPEADADDDRTDRWSTHDFEAALIRSLFDAKAVHGVSFNVTQAVRVAGTVRDRLSTDNWRVLTQLSEALARRPPRPPGLAESLDLIDRTILSLVAVGGLEMAHMTRDDGWRFMSLGRHLERLVYVSTTVAQVAASGSVEDPALLEWLLDLSDSIITYRARYMGHAEWLAVADLLLFDRRNPRSAAFQLAKLAKHVALLPGAGLESLVSGMERVAATRASDPESADLFQPSDRLTSFLDSCEQMALHLSDALTLRYFSHVYEPAHATLL